MTETKINGEEVPDAAPLDLRALIAEFEQLDYLGTDTVKVCMRPPLVEEYEQIASARTMMMVPFDKEREALTGAHDERLGLPDLSDVDAREAEAIAPLTEQLDAVQAKIKKVTAVITFQALTSKAYSKLLGRHPDRNDHHDHPDAWSVFLDDLCKECFRDVTLDGVKQPITYDGLGPIINFGKADEISRCVLNLNGRSVDIPF